jgi:EmrB/QacA subfamily drug resistance transporter
MASLNLQTTKKWVLVLASIASFMAALDSLVVTTALGTIRNDLGASIGTLQWTVNAYNLSFAVLLLTGAALGDRFGRRRMFAVGLGVFVGGSLLCATAANSAWLIGGRAIQGVGSALLIPLAMALLSAAFPPKERAKALGIFGGVTGLALIVGPLAGGLIAEGLAWQWIFWINVPIGLITIPLVLLRVQESRGARAKIDIGGLLLVSGCSFALVWGLVRGNTLGWTDIEVSNAVVAGILLGVGFVAFELRISEPMLPMRFFRIRAFAASITASLLFYAGMYGVLFFMAQFFQTAYGASPIGAGLRILPWTATLFVFAPLGGRLVNRLGERTLVVGGLMLQAIGLAWMAVLASPHVSYAALVAPMVLAGAGVSLAMPAAQTAIINSVAVNEIGKASGAFNMFRFLGGALGIAILVAVFDDAGGMASPEAFSSGFKAAVGVAALFSITGSFFGLGLPGRQKSLPESAEVQV